MSSKYITDNDAIHAARIMRADLTLLIRKWDIKTRHHNDDVIHRKIAKLLNCSDEECMFWSKSRGFTEREFGVEQHVFEGLTKLTGPNGHTLYKMLIAQGRAK